MSTYERTSQIVATPHFEANLGSMKDTIQTKMDATGYGCIVDKVWKIRGLTSNQDVLIVETLAPTSSPISELLVLAIAAVIIAAIGGYVFVYAMGFLERRDKPLSDLVHDLVKGVAHESVSDMIQWKQQNAPDEFAKNPYWCPYCGAEFPTAEQRENHIKICPEAPVPAPAQPTAGKWTPGYYISYLLSLFGYRVTRWRKA